MKRIILIFSLIITTIGLMAQKGTIKGRVYNAKTNEPLEFANILIQGTMIGSTSDLDGNYIFTGIEPGFKQLVVSLVGFETTVSPEIQVQGNQTVFVDIAVNEATLVLNEFVVKRNLNAKKLRVLFQSFHWGYKKLKKVPE